MITGKLVYLRPLQMSDADSLMVLRQRNREFVRPYEPTHKDTDFTLAGQNEIIKISLKKWQNDVGYSFGVFLKTNDRLVGRINLSNVVRGAWQSCTMGYFMDQAQNGKGLMTEAIELAVDYAFSVIDLHRVQAGVMPHNLASVRVLQKAGFNYEGLAKYYLNINGQWEDHHIYSITKECWKRSGASW